MHIDTTYSTLFLKLKRARGKKRNHVHEKKKVFRFLIVCVNWNRKKDKRKKQNIIPLLLLHAKISVSVLVFVSYFSITWKEMVSGDDDDDGGVDINVHVQWRFRLYGSCSQESPKGKGISWSSRHFWKTRPVGRLFNGCGVGGRGRAWRII